MYITRAWLILADILVVIILLLSFSLFYLYPINQSKKQTVSDTINWDKNITFDTFKDSMYIPNIKDLNYMPKESYITQEIIDDYLVTTPMKDRLDTLNAKIGDPIFIRIFKQESILEVWLYIDSKYLHFKNYKICAFSGNLGPKLKEGDRQAPEGFYKVKKNQLNPNSKFHLSFNLGYPNRYDRVHKRTGSYLMVHGNCLSIGCYAMTDDKIEEIYALVEGALNSGQKFVQVHAYPFKMTKENMALYSNNKWYEFWENLKDGYDYFESEKLPPSIKVKNKKYIILDN